MKSLNISFTSVASLRSSSSYAKVIFSRKYSGYTISSKHHKLIIVLRESKVETRNYEIKCARSSYTHVYTKIMIKKRKKKKKAIVFAIAFVEFVQSKHYVVYVLRFVVTDDEQTRLLNLFILF